MVSAVAIPGDQRRKIIASARLLESDQAGDRQAAVEAVLRLLPSGITVADLLARALPVVAFVPSLSANHRSDPVSPLRRWQRKARVVAAFPMHLNERELAFVKDMATRPGEPTAKQSDWLSNLAARVEARAAL